MLEKKYDEVGNEIVEADVETTEEETQETTEEKLDWKAAAKKLKETISKLDDSIDCYFIKAEVLPLRERYNNKERSQALFNSIMGVN